MWLHSYVLSASLNESNGNNLECGFVRHHLVLEHFVLEPEREKNLYYKSFKTMNPHR
jgi:hypothetical protein